MEVIKISMFIMFILGIVFITYGITVSIHKPVTKIEYRYIPQTPSETIYDQPYVSDIFSSMFNNESTWIGSLNDLDTRKKEEINKYYISQI